MTSDGVSRRKPYVATGYADIALAKELGGSAFVLYTYLSLRVGPNDGSWPSYDTISEDTGLARATITKALKALVGYGVIEVQKRRSKKGQQASNYYIIHDPPAPADSSESELNSTGDTEAESAANSSDPELDQSSEIELGQSSEIELELSSKRELESGEEDGASAPTADPLPNAHYRLYEICCRLNGGDPSDNPNPARQLKVFSRLLAAHGVESTAAAMRWMAGDDFWQAKGFDAFNVEKQMDRFIMMGRPSEQRPRPNGRDPRGAGTLRAARQLFDEYAESHPASDGTIPDDG